MSRRFTLHVDPGAAIPLATQIGQQLSWLIAGGALEEGDELPPVQELADELGINIHTVRAGYQQLAAGHLVSMGRGRRARVLRYDRTKQPTGIATVPTYSLGVIIPWFTPFYAPLLDGIETQAADQPALVYVTNAREHPDLALSHLDRLVAKGVDGIIIAALPIDPDEALPHVGKLPIVSIDAPGNRAPSIEFDLERSQYLATKHLIEHGHRRIGYLTPPLHRANVAPKHAGHVRALTEAGIEPDPRLTAQTDGFGIDHGFIAVEQLLTDPDPPTAIAAASDSLAIGTYRAAHQHGISIPDRLAVTGNDDSQLCVIVEPNLTTVSLPVFEAGKLAVDIIQQMRAGNSSPDRIVLDVELVIRNSCGCQGASPVPGPNGAE